jgi:hypothetical protein
MSVHSTGLSKDEHDTLSGVGSAHQSSLNDRLLYTRRQVAELLGGVDVSTVRRLEREGRLTPIRLTGRKTGQVFLRAEDVRKLIEQAAADDQAHQV